MKYLQAMSIAVRIGLCVVLVTLTAGSQLPKLDNPDVPTATQQDQDLDTIRAAARSSVYSYEQARFLSNEIGPRLSGSPQAAAAVNYVAGKMRELGLEVKPQAVMVRHWLRGREEAELIRYPGQVPGINQKLVVTALGNSVATPESGITAAVIMVNNFADLDDLPSDVVRGKIVLFNYSFDEFEALAGRADEAYARAAANRTKGPARAAQKGALAALVRSVGPPGLRLPHTGVTDNGEQRIPAAAITTEDADLIASLATQGQVTIHLLLTPHELRPEQSYNIIADLKGIEFPEQIVLVSGHLDSWDLGTGALDDATGVAIAMDAVRIIKKTCPHPKRTIRFVAWMNEENGGAGGRVYAQDHAPELNDHMAAIEIDYGDGRPLGLKVAGTDERVSPILDVLHTVADSVGGVVRTGESPGPDLDIINGEGVPAIAPFQDARHYFDYHHTAADTFDKVQIDEMRKVVELIAPLAYALAQH